MGRMVWLACRVICLLAPWLLAPAAGNQQVLPVVHDSTAAESTAQQLQLQPRVGDTQHNSLVQGRSLLDDAAKFTTEFGCVKDPVFDDPWVKAHIILTYAGLTRDGLGSQVLRLMSVYAAAATLGLQYIHSPLHCIGHFGLTTYRNSSCDGVNAELLHKMSRLAKFFSLPSSSRALVDVGSWHVGHMSGNWDSLAAKARRALQLQQPTVIHLEAAHSLAWACPDMFNHVPAWTRVELLSQAKEEAGQYVGPQYWLLDKDRAVRIAVHHRRGDVAVVATHKYRYLPVSYYLNVVQDIIQVLDAAHLDYTVEWYTEASATPDQHEDVATVRKTIPNLTMIFDSDIIWTWENMASADVLVMSLSAFSIVPAIVNSKGLIIRAPPSPIPCAANTASSQWLEPQHDGSLTPDIIAQLSSRLPRATTTGELAAAAVPAPAGLGDLPWRHELITLATGSEQLSGQIALYSSQSRRHLRVQGTH